MSRKISLAEAERELVRLMESHDEMSELTEDEKDDLSWVCNFVYRAHKEWHGKPASVWYPLLRQKVRGQA